MDIDDFFDDIQNAIEESVIECRNDVLFPATVSLVGAMKQRIHNEGLDSNGQTLGTARGRTTYSPSYAIFKRKFRNFSRIDLSLRDNLETSLKAGIINEGAGISMIDRGTGATNNPPDRSGIPNKEKAFFLEEMFNTTIWEPTQEEEDTFYDDVDFLVTRKLSMALNRVRDLEI